MKNSEMKELKKDFINYGLIACVFLIIPFTNLRFITLILILITDLIHLYIIERRLEK